MWTISLEAVVPYWTSVAQTLGKSVPFAIMAGGVVLFFLFIDYAAGLLKIATTARFKVWSSVISFFGGVVFLVAFAAVFLALLFHRP